MRVKMSGGFVVLLIFAGLLILFGAGRTGSGPGIPGITPPLYADNFNRNDLGQDWDPIYGTWMIEDGSAKGDCQTTNRGILVLNVDVGSDYAVTVRAMVETSSRGKPEAQIIFRYASEGNYYFAGVGAYGYKAAIGKFVGGSHTMIASGGNPAYADVELGAWYTLKVEVSGEEITVYVDGVEACSAVDASHPQGGVGLTCIHSVAYFDDFRVDKI